MNTQKMLLYDRWSFIRGMNVEKCRTTFLLKWSLIRDRPLITVVLNHNFHSTSVSAAWSCSEWLADYMRDFNVINIECWYCVYLAKLPVPINRRKIMDLCLIVSWWSPCISPPSRGPTGAPMLALIVEGWKN